MIIIQDLFISLTSSDANKWDGPYKWVYGTPLAHSYFVACVDGCRSMKFIPLVSLLHLPHEINLASSSKHSFVHQLFLPSSILYPAFIIIFPLGSYFSWYLLTFSLRRLIHHYGHSSHSQKWWSGQSKWYNFISFMLYFIFQSLIDF